MNFIIWDCEIWGDTGVAARRWNGLHDWPPLTIQIGAALVDTSAKITATFSRYIHPFDEYGHQAPITEYISNLTGITQKTLDRHGVSFIQALQEFEHFVGNRKIYSYGHDMRKTLLPTCFANRTYPDINPTHVRDVRQVLLAAGVPEGLIMATNSGRIADALGYDGPAFDQHDALGDVQSIVQALRILQERGALDCRTLV